MNVVFFGTPDFAVPSLLSIINSNHKVVAVVTQPDRPVGRNAEVQFSAVKKCAIENNVKVLQYEKVSLQGIDDLKAVSCDIMVTCAFGQILSKELLDIAPHGVINIHASLLPKYRGAAPIQYAVINGDNETGVTIMQTEEGLDSGDIIAVSKVHIGKDETSGELFERLSKVGADLIVNTLDDIEAGKAIFLPQNHSEATKVRQIKKSDAQINWNLSTNRIFNLVRGMQPWPCAFTYYNGKMLKVFKVEKLESSEIDNCENFAVGTIIYADVKTGIVVKTSDGALKLVELQLEGAKRMNYKDFILGRRITVGERFE